MKYLTQYVALLLCYEASAQSPLPGVRPGAAPRLLPSDSSVLELQEPRRDFRCSVTPMRPRLGFDFLFHTGYRVTVPMKEFGAGQNKLTILFRVTPSSRPEHAVYFSEGIRIPAAQDHRGGVVALEGNFLVGAGKYHVDWLMRDLEERFCTGFWDIEGSLGAKEGDLAETVAPGLIQAAENDPFADEPRLPEETGDRRLSVKVIVDLASHNSAVTAPTFEDLDALSAILRKISREPRIGSFSMVACSLLDRRILYRQELDRKIDLPALGRALTPTTFATVSITDLNKSRNDEFLSTLIVNEWAKDRPDAVIILSSNSESEVSLSQGILAQLQNAPIFYFNYRTARYAWSADSVGRMVKRLHGREYVISQPYDFFEAWSDLIAQVDGRHSR